MKKNLTEKGFSLVEMVVASAILGVVILGGMSAWKYFHQSAVGELAKADSMGEFNQLTKDLMKFTEGGGISTAYLNLPMEVANCDVDPATNNPRRPCVMKMKDGKLVPADPTEIPEKVNKTCTQFYKDSGANIAARRAFPGSPSNDLLLYLDDLNVKTNDVELLAAWPLVDENSVPFLMLKMQHGGLYLSLLRGPSEVSRGFNNGPNGPKEEYAFFEFPINDPTNADGIKRVLDLKNQAFLVYNTFYTNHYTIQYAEDIQHCASFDCFGKLKKLSKKNSFIRAGFPTEEKALTEDLNTLYPTNVFAVKLKAIDLGSSYFKDIVGRQKLPESCYSAWDLQKQTQQEYFFPTKSYSVYSPDNNTADDIGGPEPLNVLHLNHFYTASLPLSASASVKKGLMVAVPINIGVYKVVPNGATGTKKNYSLVLSKWKPDMKEDDWQVRISKLEAPFIITRRIGTSEMSIWYNPAKSDAK